MDNKQFGIYVLIVAAVVLVAVGFNNITGQTQREKTCTGFLKLDVIPLVGGAKFKVTSTLNEDFRNVVEVARVLDGVERAVGSYTIEFSECGTTCNPRTLKENNGELTTKTKQLPAKDSKGETITYVGKITNPCTGNDIKTKWFTV